MALTDDYIERRARELHKALWKDRYKLNYSDNQHELSLLDESNVSKLLGISINFKTTLGRFGSQDRFEVAGAIDRNKSEIQISERFPLEVQRFTFGHELGHFDLHKEEIMHRDKPISGLTQGTIQKPPKEREADYYSACFLMPRKLVIKEFQLRFGKQPIHFNENICFWLDPNGSNNLLYSDPRSLKRESALASCTYYNGGQVLSLAKLFKVSVSSMAIRLSELKLVKYP